MRFVFAIAAFFAAAVMIGLGIAQRTVFLDADRVTLSTSIESDADYIVVEPAALAAQPGKQTLDVSGSETVFVAYGRTADVEAWLGEEPYLSVGYDSETTALTTELQPSASSEDPVESDPSATPGPTDTPAPTPTPVPTTPAATDPAAPAEPAVSPAGSDLWLDEFSGDGAISTTVDVPGDISLLIASGSASPPPTRFSITWPLDNSTPWAGPLIVGGALVFAGGVGLLISGVLQHRRSRGPRRNLPKGPRGMPRASRGPALRRGSSKAGGRRAIGRAPRLALIPIIAVPALLLSACSAEYWPSFGSVDGIASTPTPTPGADDEADLIQPAVTVPQMERIMRRVAVVANEADVALDANAAATRFAGPALEVRQANYKIRASLPDYAVPAAVPASPIEVTLPEQTDVWPRTVLTITKPEDETIAPTALVMVQQTPRDNYRIYYSTALIPDAQVPEVAPAELGAPPVSPEYKGLALPPGEVAAAFADISQNGTASTFAPLFDLEATDLDEALNAQTRKAEIEAANPTLTLTITTVPGDAQTISLGTIDAGAIVTAEIVRTEESRPNDGGTTGFAAGGAAAALSGFTQQSAKGVQRTNALQAVFYVPAVGSDAQIQLLGWSEGIVAASEVP